MIKIQDFTKTKKFREKDESQPIFEFFNEYLRNLETTKYKLFGDLRENYGDVMINNQIHSPIKINLDIIGKYINNKDNLYQEVFNLGHNKTFNNKIKIKNILYDSQEAKNEVSKNFFQHVKRRSLLGNYSNIYKNKTLLLKEKFCFSFKKNNKIIKKEINDQKNNSQTNSNKFKTLSISPFITKNYFYKNEKTKKNNIFFEFNKKIKNSRNKSGINHLDTSSIKSNSGINNKQFKTVENNESRSGLFSTQKNFYVRRNERKKTTFNIAEFIKEKNFSERRKHLIASRGKKKKDFIDNKLNLIEKKIKKNSNNFLKKIKKNEGQIPQLKLRYYYLDYQSK